MNKKVLFISHMYPTNYDKSYGKVIHEQALSLIKLGYRIKVICPIPYTFGFLKYFKKKYENLSGLPEKEIHDGIEVYYPRYLLFPKSYLFKFSGLLMYIGIMKKIRLLKTHFDFNIIHAHFGMPDSYAAMKISKLLNVPLITTLQATDLDNTINKNKSCKTNLQKAFLNSSEVISPTPRLQKQLFTSLDIQSRNIGYGIDMDRVLVSPPTHISDIYADKIIIVSVSRLLKTKGLDYNIKAIEQLRNKYKNIYYLIIGDGPEKENLLNLVNLLGVEKNVEFLGELDHKKTLEYISIAHIFSLPSWQETFGLVYLEAMVNGKPVIGCKDQGFDGIIEHNYNGYLAEPRDTESVCNIIDNILTNPEQLSEVQRKAEKTVLDEYTFDKIALKIDNLYKLL